jgi:hypothetical protein
MRKGMRLRLSTAALISLFAAGSAQAQFMPKNNLDKEDNLFRAASMTQADFNAIINSIIEQYKPLATLHGGNLSSNNKWSDATVNASAEQQTFGSRWIVNMYGGLARRPEVTPDGFALVVCHELGHHFGGYAFYSDDDWAGAEGQADYFATESCAHKIWGTQLELNAKAAETVAPTAKAKCDAAWGSVDQRNLCYRTATASMSLATLLAKLGSEADPSFDKNDPAVVTTTDVNHPAGQCRLDTYVNGALCATAFDENVIPGRNHAEGQTSKAAELEAGKYSCLATKGTRVVGDRPLCWFAPVN